MAGALVKRDNVKGLGERFDTLVDEYPETFDMIAETDLTTYFQNAGLLLCRHSGPGGCICASFGPARQEASQQFNKAAPAPPHQPLLRQRPAAGKNGASPADEPPTPPASGSEGAEPGACDPGEGAAPRPATS